MFSIYDVLRMYAVCIYVPIYMLICISYADMFSIYDVFRMYVVYMYAPIYIPICI